MSSNYSYVSTELTNEDALPNTLNSVVKDSGKVRLKEFNYTTSVALDAGSSIELLRFPKGAKPVGGAIKFSALGSGRTLDVGFSGDLDGVLDGIDVSSAGQDTMFELAQGDALALTALTSADSLVATILGDTFPVDGTLQGFVEFVAID